MADPAAAWPHVDARTALDRAAPFLHLRPLLVVSDFDGTLAHLSGDPWGPRILPGAQAALRRLATLPDVHVAFLSGRTAADLAGRVRVGGATYLGDHGTERGRLPRGARAERLEIAAVPLPPHLSLLTERVARAVEAAVPETWLVVERKLPAVTFHFRTAPDLGAAAARIAAVVDATDAAGALVRFPGRRALELRAPGAPAKAETLRALLDAVRPAAAFMLGDDRHDARAFTVLRRARGAGELAGLALAVAAHADVLPEVAPHADLVLASPVESAGFLRGVARRAAEAGA